MARITLLCPDLLFGSKVEGALGLAGHDVRRVDSDDGVRAELAGSALLIVDLTSDGERRSALVESLRSRGELDQTPALAFYSHVDQDTRQRADAAGFDQVVPRSRMAREAVALAERMMAA